MKICKLLTNKVLQHWPLEDDFSAGESSHDDEDEVEAEEDPPMVWHAQRKRKIFNETKSDQTLAATSGICDQCQKNFVTL
jgi:hypothetical protein